MLLLGGGDWGCLLLDIVSVCGEAIAERRDEWLLLASWGSLKVSVVARCIANEQMFSKKGLISAFLSSSSFSDHTLRSCAASLRSSLAASIASRAFSFTYFCDI